MSATKQQLREERRRQIDAQPLHPDYFYRLSDGEKFFGYRSSTLEEKIKTGEIPPTVSLSDTGRARGWFGRTIIAWQLARESKAAAKAKVE